MIIITIVNSTITNDVYSDRTNHIKKKNHTDDDDNNE